MHRYGFLKHITIHGAFHLTAYMLLRAILHRVFFDASMYALALPPHLRVYIAQRREFKCDYRLIDFYFCVIVPCALNVSPLRCCGEFRS